MSRKTIVALIVALIIAGGFIYVFAQYYSSPSQPGLSLDWRVKLAIYDARTGRNLSIPVGVGVAGGIWVNHTLDEWSPQGYAPLSTREPSQPDGTAIIYIQSLYPRLYYLGDFFDIWGQPLNRTCVLNYCESPSTPVPFLTDGNKEFCLQHNTLWDNHITWEIIIGSGGMQRQCG